MRSAILLIGTAAIAISSPAFAQSTQEDVAQAANQPEDTEANDEIIVTATKRASRVQDVPFSINAQTQEDIQRANAVTLEDISRNVAGLSVLNQGPGQSQVSIRGVSAGEVVRDQAGTKEQVGVYLDESVVSLSLFTPDFDLFDLNRVETLRGPQGTLFGSGSVGGTVRYITNQPRLAVTEGLVEGNVNLVDESDIGGHLKGAVNVPLGPTLAARVVGYATRYAGFIDAEGPAEGDNVNDGSRIGTRASLLWEPDPDVKFTPRVVYQQVRADGFNREDVFTIYANEFTDPPSDVGRREQYLKTREKFKDDTLLLDLTASVSFGAVELTSITSYIDRELFVARDASALTGSITSDILLDPTDDNPDPSPEDFNDAVNLTSKLVDRTDLKQWTQEFRVASTGAGPFQWVAGLFATDIDRTYRQSLPTPGYDDLIGTVTGGDFGPDSPYNSILPYEIDQRSVFGEGSYDFGDVKTTIGGRYYTFHEKRRFLSGGIFSGNDDRTDKNASSGFSPRFIATYEPTRNFSVNLQAAKGFRLGGVNDPLNVPLCEGDDIETFGGFQFFEDETLWNYEAGTKYSAGPITFNAAAFYTDIKNLQINVTAGSCSSRVSFNVPKAHTKGLEAELSARPMPGLDLSIAGSLVEAEFDSTLPEATAVATGIREGNRLPGVPKFQMAATATYGQRFSPSADWYVSTSYQHVGSRFTQAADQEFDEFEFASGVPLNGAPGTDITVLSLKLPSYDLVNLSAGLEFDSGLEVVAYVNNLFDESPKLSFDRERGGRARLGFNVGQPRTIGLTVRQSFGQ